jgi:formate dehydrogenase subunit gamma
LKANRKGETVERFCKTTRWFHWTFVLSFLTLAGTGGVLLLREQLALAAGTTEALVDAHLIAAVALLFAPGLVGLSGDTGRWLADLAEVTRFDRDDLVWLARQPLALLGRAELPAQGKLNAGQKLNALSVVALTGALTVSGVHLWREPGAFAAVLVHVAAFVAWIPAFLVHFYMAVINPGTRPALRAMITGSVDRKWAEHHHALWVERVDAGAEQDRA